MSDDLDPLEPELARLFAAERADASPLDPAVRDRMLARIEGAVPPTAVPRFPLGHVLAALVVGGVGGAAIATALVKPEVVYVDRVITAPASAAPEDPPPSVPSVVRPAPEDVAPPAPVVRDAGPVQDSLAREHALLDIAHTALGRREGARALEAAERHAREFPRGQMTEEREAIAVQSLVLVGRSADAKARAARFHEHYPASVYLPVVDAATSE